MLFTQKSGDSYSFLNNLNFKDEKELKRLKKEFLKKSKNKINADYDRGFFSAWADYIRMSIKALTNTE